MEAILRVLREFSMALIVSPEWFSYHSGTVLWHSFKSHIRKRIGLYMTSTTSSVKLTLSTLMCNRLFQSKGVVDY